MTRRISFFASYMDRSLIVTWSGSYADGRLSLAVRDGRQRGDSLDITQAFYDILNKIYKGRITYCGAT